MKYLFLSLTLLIGCMDGQGQDNKGSMRMEITKLNAGVYGGFYTGRAENSNSGFAGAGQIYLPFRWVVDYENNFEGTSTNEYNNRVFLIRPSVIVQTYSDIAYGFGLANQLSFKLFNNTYLEYQIGLVYNEATIAAQPDIYSGFSLHHTASIAAPLNIHWTLFGAYMHISNAGLIEGDNSVVDVFGVGLRYVIL